ncbi:hypothetical protein AB6M97_09495 [Streptococcus hillyeri]|uniref:Uncharacterized protein n=1 Tax=Streptococcus hillyeri TaxID=2282420 RepID=A0A3L9DT63_9STRE|nr:hypothetical protein [Streptococcus hillyeri]RLY03634.1 hypothetical protein EAF07_04970 [Streptococcus hillyeri]
MSNTFLTTKKFVQSLCLATLTACVLNISNTVTHAQEQDKTPITQESRGTTKPWMELEAEWLSEEDYKTLYKAEDIPYRLKVLEERRLFLENIIAESFIDHPEKSERPQLIERYLQIVREIEILDSIQKGRL